jgi:chaperone modulatory protein CbpM
MENEIVEASVFCIHHNIELSFIQTLQEHELIETVLIDEKVFLPVAELGRLEKIIRLHFELDINLEGIETITHLLERMEKIQQENARLTKLLKVYGK